jgi:HPt (histidine-containing phosphotransfer) domain-containing protein
MDPANPDDEGGRGGNAILDRQVLIDLTDGADAEDLEMLRRVVASYCSGRLVAEARRAMQAEDWAACERSAHSLKGLSATLGAMAAAAAAAELERDAERCDPVSCRRKLARLAEEHQRSHRALAATDLYDARLVEDLTDD